MMQQLVDQKFTIRAAENMDEKLRSVVRRVRQDWVQKGVVKLDVAKGVSQTPTTGIYLTLVHQ